MCKGCAGAFPHFCYAFHLLHSRFTVPGFSSWFVDGLPDCRATAIWMFGVSTWDCDHHDVGDLDVLGAVLRIATTTTWELDRYVLGGKMESPIWQRKGLAALGTPVSIFNFRSWNAPTIPKKSPGLRRGYWIVAFWVGSEDSVWQQNTLHFADCPVSPFNVWSRDLLTIPQLDPGL